MLLRIPMAFEDVDDLEFVADVAKKDYITTKSCASNGGLKLVASTAHFTWKAGKAYAFQP